MTQKIDHLKKLRFQELLMKKIDDEISRAEVKEFEEIVAKYPECRAEWKEQQKIKEAAQMLKYTNPPDEIWDSYWLGIYNRLERKIGWILLSVGSIVLIAYGLINAALGLIADTAIPVWLKAAIFISAIGFAILLVSVIREKIFTYKSDPYKEIKR